MWDHLITERCSVAKSNYTAVVSVQGPIRTASVSRLHFVIGEAPVDVLMANLLQFEDGGWFQKGIRLTLSVSAESMEDAITIVETTSDLMVPLLAISAAAETPKVQLEQIYTDDPDVSRGEVARFVNVALPETKMRKVYLNHLEPLYVGLAAGDQRLASV